MRRATARWPFFMAVARTRETRCRQIATLRIANRDLGSSLVQDSGLTTRRPHEESARPDLDGHGLLRCRGAVDAVDAVGHAVRHRRRRCDHTTGLASDTDTSVVSGIMDGSRFGLRGSEDLGGGYRAIFTLENRTEREQRQRQQPPGNSARRCLIASARRRCSACRARLQPVVNAVAAQIGSGIGVNLAERLLGPAGLRRAGHTGRCGARRAVSTRRGTSSMPLSIRWPTQSGFAVRAGRRRSPARPSTSASAMRCSTASSWVGFTASAMYGVR